MAKGRVSGEITQKAIREASIRLIARHGYHGVSLRTLADEIGIQAASLYNHIENKQDLLFVLLRGIMEDLVAEVAQKVAQEQGTLSKLCTFVAAHVEFHARRQPEVFIGTMELRSLLPENRTVLVALRDRHEELLQSLVDAGIRERAFSVPSARVATFAILAMLNGVANWYRKNGRHSIPDLQRMYVELTLNLLGTSPAVQELLRSRDFTQPPPAAAGVKGSRRSPPAPAP
jgi:AcrR family transcriptional regulator